MDILNYRVIKKDELEECLFFELSFLGLSQNEIEQRAKVFRLSGFYPSCLNFFCAFNQNNQIVASASFSVIDETLITFNYPIAEKSFQDINILLDKFVEYARSLEVKGLQLLVDDDEQGKQRIQKLRNTCLEEVGTLDTMMIKNRCVNEQLFDLNENFEVKPYEQSIQSDFEALLLDTFVDSLDCVALQKYRTGQSIVREFINKKTFSPENWMMVYTKNEHKPVAMLCCNQESVNRYFIEYIGVHHEYREQKLAKYLFLNFMNSKHSDNYIYLVLFNKNVPATIFYQKLGFEKISQKHVFLYQY